MNYGSMERRDPRGFLIHHENIRIDRAPCDPVCDRCLDILQPDHPPEHSRAVHSGQPIRPEEVITHGSKETT